MYSIEFVNEALRRVADGEQKEKIIREMGMSRGTLFSWIRGETPHKQLFKTKQKYRKNYYQTHKADYKRRGYISRLGFDGEIVLKRDNHKCKSCGREKKLEIHHIDGDNTNNSHDNLIMICKACHTVLNLMIYNPFLSMLFLKHRDQEAKNMEHPTKCPLCQKKYKYFIAFATHMLRKHRWCVEKSLDYFSEHRK